MLKTISISVIAIVLPLYLWRIFYSATDWAAAFLIFLAVALFVGVFFTSSSLYKAQLAVAVRATSPHKKWFTGRLRARLRAVAFTTIAIPILAWQAITVTPEVAVGLILLCVFSSGFTIWAEKSLGIHLTIPFARIAGGLIGTAAAIIIFVPVLAWVNLSIVSYPEELKTLTWSQMVLFGLQELPERRGPISEVLSYLYALEYSKLWLVIQLGSSRWASVLFSFDTALGGVIAARASAVLTGYVRYRFEDYKS